MTAGWNQYGQLGYQDKDNRGDLLPPGVNEMGVNLPCVNLGDFPVKAINMGSDFSCGLLVKADNTIGMKCFGATPPLPAPVTIGEIALGMSESTPENNLRLDRVI